MISLSIIKPWYLCTVHVYDKVNGIWFVLMQCDVRVLDFIKMVAFIFFIDKQLLGEKQNKLI